jgi:hypothetical protein
MSFFSFIPFDLILSGYGKCSPDGASAKSGIISLGAGYMLPSFETPRFARLLRMRPENGAPSCAFATHTDLILRSDP